MYSRKSKYPAELDALIEGCVMVKLAEADRALNLEEIIQGEPLLAGVTTQKLARVMSKFVDMGFIVKTKGQNGRMVYRTVAALEEEGCERNPLTAQFYGAC